MRPADHPDLFAARGDVRKRPSVAALVPRMLHALDRRGWVITRRLLSQSNQMRERVRQIERVRHAACGDLGSAA